MKIGILQCDRVRDKFVPQYGQYPEMFSALLKKADPTLIFTAYDAEQGDLPSHIDAADAYLITGSHHGVNDNLPWIAQLEVFVRALHLAQKKMVGICFGHQLIAKALGGKVINSPKGWGVGMSKNKITQQKSWMYPSRGSLNLLVCHQDQVVELPPGAELLASNDLCPFYMLQLGNNLTIQGHPEFSKAYFQAIIEDRRDVLGKEVYEQGLQSLHLEKHDEIFAQWMVNFFVAAN